MQHKSLVEINLNNFLQGIYMLKQEVICPNCDQQYIIVSVNSEISYCPFCGDDIGGEDQRGELDMSSDDE